MIIKIDTNNNDIINELDPLGADIITFGITNQGINSLGEVAINERTKNLLSSIATDLSVHIGEDVFEKSMIHNLALLTPGTLVDIFYYNTFKTETWYSELHETKRVLVYGFAADSSGDPYTWIAGQIIDIKKLFPRFYQINLFSDQINDPWMSLIENSCKCPDKEDCEGIQLHDLKRLVRQYPIILSSGYFEPKTISDLVISIPNLQGLTILFDEIPYSKISKKIDRVSSIIESVR